MKSPQQIAADTKAPSPTLTTAKVVSQVLTSSVQMRGVVYPATQYDVYPSAPESDSSASGSGCIARQGFHSADANTFSQQAQEMLGQRLAPGQNPASPPGQPTAAQNKTQIAMAVADANCTLSSDLSGIYFAVQANYEKQFVSANRQALNAGIREYKAAFAKAVKTMPALLQKTSATPNLPGPVPGHHGRHHGAAKPSPSHS